MVGSFLGFLNLQLYLQPYSGMELAHPKLGKSLAFPEKITMQFYQQIINFQNVTN